MKQVLCPEAKEDVMIVLDGWSYFITVALHLLLLEVRKSGARVRKLIALSCDLLR